MTQPAPLAQPSSATATVTAPSALWYTRCAVPTASSLAFQQGWLQKSFAEIGIGLDSVRASEDDAIRNSHYDNSLANQFREGGNVPPIWAKAKGANTVVVGITWVDEFQGIVTRADSGLTSLKDLAGRRVGLPNHPSELVDHGRASAHHGFVSALAIAGLAQDAVTYVDLTSQRADIREDAKTGILSQPERQGSPVLEALREGRIDAAYVKGPGGIASVRKHGLRVLYDLTTHPDRRYHVNNAVPRPITADRELLTQHPELVIRYLEVLVRTGRWAAEHPAEALRLVAHETGSSEADAAVAYGPELHLHLAPTLDPEVVAGLEREKDFLRDHGYLPQDVDFAAWIVHGPLAEAQRRVAAHG